MTLRRRLLNALALTIWVIAGPLTPADSGAASVRVSPAYEYDAPAQVVVTHDGVASEASPTTTTPTAQKVAGARVARPSLRTSPGVVRLVSGFVLAAKGGRGGIGPVRLGQAGEDAVWSSPDLVDGLIRHWQLGFVSRPNLPPGHAGSSSTRGGSARRSRGG